MWSTIGDATVAYEHRLSLTYTLILVQSLVGLVLSVVICSAAPAFANGFVPPEVRRQSTTYVRISAFSALSSAMEAAVAASTRALDKPDVPLVVSAIKFAANICLDMLFISTFHVGSVEPTVDMQASIQLTCNLAAAFGGLVYFLARQMARKGPGRSGRAKPSIRALWVLVPPGIPTLIESAVRNALYLWLIHTIVGLGALYATAWGVFNTIRWGLVMVPVSALEATTLTFVGHNWGAWKSRASESGDSSLPRLSELLGIARPALVSICLAIGFEVPVCLFMSFLGARPFARYLSGSDEIAGLTAHMWKTLDWVYILYAVSIQLAAVLLATRPKWYLLQSLATNLLYVLPWAIVCQVSHLDAQNAWTYHAMVFGGSMVFSFVCTPTVLGLWAWGLISGRARVW